MKFHWSFDLFVSRIGTKPPFATATHYLVRSAHRHLRHTVVAMNHVPRRASRPEFFSSLLERSTETDLGLCIFYSLAANSARVLSLKPSSG